MTDVRLLDSTISILKGSGGAKRAPRRAQVEIILLLGSEGDYTLTSNGRILAAGAGTEQEARDIASKQADRVRALGKSVIVTVYGGAE